jgi:hypothetical protein
VEVSSEQDNELSASIKYWKFFNTCTRNGFSRSTQLHEIVTWLVSRDTGVNEMCSTSDLNISIKPHLKIIIFETDVMFCTFYRFWACPVLVCRRPEQLPERLSTLYGP